MTTFNCSKTFWGTFAISSLDWSSNCRARKSRFCSSCRSMHSVRSSLTRFVQCFMLWRRVYWGCTFASVTILGAVLLLDALCDGLVSPLSQLQQSLASGVGRLQGLDESGPARGSVRVALARLAVAYDVGTLRTPVSGAMLADVSLRDA